MAFNVRRRKRGTIFGSNNEFTISSTEPNVYQEKATLSVLSVLWLIILYAAIFHAIPLANRGIVFSTSTEENCKIMNYTTTDCVYGCDCQLIMDPSGEHHKICKRCNGKQYIYKAIAESKCGNKMLIQTKHEQRCPEKPYELNKVIKCYVPHCHFKTFTYHHHYRIILEAVILSIICVSLLIWIPYHIFTSWKRKKLTLFMTPKQID
eukprot:291228_1